MTIEEVLIKPQTIKELARELGYTVRHTRDIANEMVRKGEWEVVKIPDPEALINAYIRSPKKKNNGTLQRRKY